jgi:hypothetical protein
MADGRGGRYEAIPLKTHHDFDEALAAVPARTDHLACGQIFLKSLENVLSPRLAEREFHEHIRALNP